MLWAAQIIDLVTFFQALDTANDGFMFAAPRTLQMKGVVVYTYSTPNTWNYDLSATGPCKWQICSPFFALRALQINDLRVFAPSQNKDDELC